MDMAVIEQVDQGGYRDYSLQNPHSLSRIDVYFESVSVILAPRSHVLHRSTVSTPLSLQFYCIDDSLSSQFYCVDGSLSSQFYCVDDS
jgi:hypothetical protein